MQKRRNLIGNGLAQRPRSPKMELELEELGAEVEVKVSKLLSIRAKIHIRGLLLAAAILLPFIIWVSVYIV